MHHFFDVFYFSFYFCLSNLSALIRRRCFFLYLAVPGSSLSVIIEPSGIMNSSEDIDSVVSSTIASIRRSPGLALLPGLVIRSKILSIRAFYLTFLSASFSSRVSSYFFSSSISFSSSSAAFGLPLRIKSRRDCWGASSPSSVTFLSYFPMFFTSSSNSSSGK